MRLPWRSRDGDDLGQADPYWEDFIHRPPADPNNLITHAFQSVKAGGVNPVRSEIHSPNVMAEHVKELGRFYGAERVAIVDRGPDEMLRFAIVCALKSEHDTRATPGIGGQAPALRGLFVSFNLVAWIHELGYQATRSGEDAVRLGGLVNWVQGPRLHVADVVYTDLPLQADAA